MVCGRHGCGRHGCGHHGCGRHRTDDWHDWYWLYWFVQWVTEVCVAAVRRTLKMIRTWCHLPSMNLQWFIYPLDSTHKPKTCLLKLSMWKLVIQCIWIAVWTVCLCINLDAYYINTSMLSDIFICLCRTVLWWLQPMYCGRKHCVSALLFHPFMRASKLLSHLGQYWTDFHQTNSFYAFWDRDDRFRFQDQ